MINFDYKQPDYVDFVHKLAETFKVKLTGNRLVIPPNLGSGYIWAETLPMGMTVMVIDTTMKEEYTFTRLASSEQFFLLQFNEYSSVASDKSHAFNKNKYGHQQQSAVRLSHTLVPEITVLPAEVNLQSVRFFFTREQLSNLLGPVAIDSVFNKYFPVLITTENLEPIATDYRVTLNELQVEKIEVPLRLNFIQNRVFLLLEKFILKLHGRKDMAFNKSRRTDDETLRLMKIEALLVKDFTVKSLTIEQLSRMSAMSPTKLKNDFKSLYGLPIYEYYQKNRMLKAKSLLLLGKYSIKEVGIKVGYSNLSHFASSFKKEFNILPREVSAKDGVLIYNT